MILLTGASGYLGRHVEAVLSARGTPHVGTVHHSCDLTDGKVVDELARRVKPDVIIHCAAVVPKDPASYHDDEAAKASVEMMRNVTAFAACPIIFPSSLVVADRWSSAYAYGKWQAEQYLSSGSVLMRLPGLFGLPRRSGVIYNAAKSGVIPDSFGPYPSMHVADAAEYLVRAATMPGDGNREPFTVTYGDPRLEVCYGSLGVTFDQRVRELVAELAA